MFWRVVPEKNAQKWGILKPCNWLQNATASTKIKIWWRPVVPEKNAQKWENSETLQVAVEYHSMNKNQSLIKIKTSSSWQKCKKVRKFWNFATGCRVPQYEQNLKFDQDRTSSSQKNAKMWEIFETLTIGCRVPQHIQKLKFDEDQTSSCWEKMQKSKKILKLYHEPVVAEKSTKNWENIETLPWAKNYIVETSLEHFKVGIKSRSDLLKGNPAPPSRTPPSSYQT